jgi:uncharacterized OB-fold protein
MSDDRFLPDIDAEPYARPLWEAAQEERLVIQQCAPCSQAQFYPRPLCQQCGAAEFDWVEVAGTGTIASYTVIRRTVALHEFADEIPYAVGYVDLSEGPRIYTRFADCDPEAIEIGQEVQVTFEPVSDDVTLPLFQQR